VPIARYFIFVGGTLAALLLITGWYLPTPPAMFANQLGQRFLGSNPIGRRRRVCMTKCG
jgi:hypothetical protein